MTQVELETALYEPLDLELLGIEETDNPYEVQLQALALGPDGKELCIPGFYKKDRTWCIRFSPVLIGEWTVTTLASLPSLSGKQWKINALPVRNSMVHGVLQIHPEHAKHFIYQDGAPFFSMGYEVNWLWAVDQTSASIEHLEHLLDELAASGFNHLFINSFAYDTSWRQGKTTEFDVGPPAYLPWQGIPGSLDYSRLNEDYFAHFDRMMQALCERGMQAHVYMKVYNKLVDWPERGTKEEDLYFDYFTARYQAFPNVIWNFSKESYYEPDKRYIARRLARIKSLDAYSHLVTIHDDKCFSFHDHTAPLIDFVTDQNHWDLYHTILHQHTLRQVPIINEEFGYEQAPGVETDATWGWDQSPLEVVERAYEVVMAGGYPTHYYTNHAWDIVKWDEMPQALPAYRQMRQFFTSFDWVRFEPMPHYVRQHAGRCLMSPDGSEMVLYAPKGITNLITDWLPKAWEGYWMDIWTGDRIASSIHLVDGGSGDVRSPFQDQSSVGYFTILNKREEA